MQAFIRLFLCSGAYVGAFEGTSFLFLTPYTNIKFCLGHVIL